MYKNISTKGKEKCRDEIYKIASKLPRQVHGRRSTVLTLPSINFSLEERLADLPNISLHCLEKEYSVYHTQFYSPIYRSIKKKMREYMYLQHSDALIQHRFGVRRYALVHLDLCQSLQISLINRWLSFIQTIPLEEVAYVAITIMGKREVHASQICRFYRAVNIQEFREKIFPDLTVNFAKLAGRRCTLMKQYKYAGEGGCPMLFYLFKIKS